MKHFLYGNFESKINDKVLELISKNNFIKIEYQLDESNYTEILSGLSSVSLFGEKNLFVIEVSDTDPDILEDFIKLLPKDTDIAITCKKDLDKTSKILKLISKEFAILEYKKTKSGNVFLFTDYLISKDVKKSYQELSKLDENEVLIFNNIVSVMRSLLSLSQDLSYKSKILPFKIGLFKSALNKFSESEIKSIYNNLYLNDLKFKKGEISDEMLLLHTVNLFFINKNGDNK